MKRNSWIIFGLLALVVTLTGLKHANSEDAADDVFYDEGDGDFDSMPILPQDEKAQSAEPSAPVAAPSEPAAAESPADGWASKGEIKPEEEEAKPAPKAKTAKAEKSAKQDKSVKPGAGRFMVTKSECKMMREPASAGSPMVVVKPKRKIWVEEVDSKWMRGYNSAGEPGYLNRGCLK